MHDGRNYASWQSGATINENLRKKTGIKQNWEYRKYLVDNADSIIKQNQINACDQCSNCKLDVDHNKYPQAPYIYNSSNEKSQPYGYEDSDLKNLYLSKHDLQSRQVIPVYTQDQLIKKYFPNSK
tara:strand:- start:2535 stop:2909 length:375 start_codon:yes stop_codon:yes gene_type:complete